MKADALSTAGLVLGPSEAVELWRRLGVEGILFYRSDHGPQWLAPPGFPAVSTPTRRGPNPSPVVSIPPTPVRP